jgi:hypothetical protein
MNAPSTLVASVARHVESPALAEALRQLAKHLTGTESCSTAWQAAIKWSHKRQSTASAIAPEVLAAGLNADPRVVAEALEAALARLKHVEHLARFDRVRHDPMSVRLEWSEVFAKLRCGGIA